MLITIDLTYSITNAQTLSYLICQKAIKENIFNFAFNSILHVCSKYSVFYTSKMRFLCEWNSSDFIIKDKYFLFAEKRFLINTFHCILFAFYKAYSRLVHQFNSCY